MKKERQYKWVRINILLIYFSCTMCFPKTCKDIYVREINNDELSLIPNYVPGDTVFYLDVGTGKEYLANCLYRKLELRERLWVNDYKCKNDGYLYIFDQLEMRMEFINFPFDKFVSLIYILRIPEPSLYLNIGSTAMWLSYDVNNHKIIKDPLTKNDLKIIYIDQISINNQIFNDVYKVYNTFGKFDTIYYNGEFGFLRMIGNDNTIDIVIN